MSIEGFEGGIQGRGGRRTLSLTMNDRTLLSMDVEGHRPVLLSSSARHDEKVRMDQGKGLGNFLFSIERVQQYLAHLHSTTP